MSTKIFGVKIYCQDKDSPVAENTAIGLYNVAGSNSEFRWVQALPSGVTTWKETMLADRGIGKYSRHIDITRGGNVADPGECEITVKNTSQFFDTVADLGINFEGLKCEIYLFTDATPTLQWTGICQSPSWTSTEYRIPVRGYHNKRIANITSLTDGIGTDSIPIPVTFGKHLKGRLRLTEQVDTKWTTSGGMMLDAATGLTCDTTYRNIGIDTFLVTATGGGGPAYTYTVQFASTDYHTAWRIGSTQIFGGTYSLDYFVDRYLLVVSGNQSGQCRKIKSASVNLTDSRVKILITIDDDNPFEANLETDNTCFIQVIDRDKTFKLDSWPCYGPINDVGVPITYGHGIYIHEERNVVDTSISSASQPVRSYDAEYRAIGKNAFTVIQNVSNNQLGIDNRIAESDLDSTNAYAILPIDTIKRLRLTNFANWGLDTTSIREPYPGMFTEMVYPTYSSQATDAELNDNPTDRDGNTYSHDLWSVSSASHNGDLLFWAVKMTPPELPDDLEFDSVYIGIKAKAGVDNSYVTMKWRRFAGTSVSIATDKAIGDHTGPTGFSYAYFETLPGGYFGSENNEKFFYTKDNVLNGSLGGNPIFDLNGYQLFELSNITSRDTYKQIYELLLKISWESTNWFTSSPIYFVDLYEVAFIFKKSSAVKKDIYTPLYGRNLGGPSTYLWGGRISAATNPIEYPQFLLEHIARLQTWADTCITPTLGWGKEYADAPLISTNAFDSTDADFLSVKTMRCAAQFFDLDQCYTDKLKRAICRDFHLASYVDKSGYECVQRVVVPSDTASDTVTLADIVDRHGIKVIEPNPSDVFCEPFVRYDRNSATGEYQKSIYITNASAATYSSAFVKGLSGEEGAEYWRRCHALWEKCRFINKPPSDLTDLTFANGEDADIIAKEHLRQWIDTQYCPQIEFPVHFNKAGLWEECKRFSVQFPHQTNNAVMESRATDIVINPNPPYDVTVRGVMYREAATVEDFYIQDTMTILTGDDNWEDTMTAGNEIQDSM